MKEIHFNSTAIDDAQSKKVGDVNTERKSFSSK